MKVRSHMLSPSVARGIAVMCAAAFVASAHTTQAGVNVSTSHGPGVASVTVLAIDPNTPLILYAGTYQGVYKSTDGGDTWNAANTGLLGNASVNALAIDPTTPGTLYATSGGVYKSTDCADTWNAANTGLPDNASVNALAIDPTTPGTLYAAPGFCGYYHGCSGSVYKSTDGGDTWNAANTGLLSSPFVYALAIDPTTPGTLYAGTALYSHGVVYKSTDGGDTWNAVNTGLFTSFFALAIAPTTPSTVYAGTFQGVFESTDGGDTWAAVNFPGLPVFAPNMPGTLYAAPGRGVLKSTDGGSSWAAVNTGLQFCLGDCNDDGTVTVDDLLIMVNIARGDARSSECFVGDDDADGQTTVDEIVAAVNNALSGCGVGE